METETTLVLLFVVVTAVAIAVRRLAIPYTVALVLTGLALGLLHAFEAPHLTKALLFSVFLPGLLFDAAYYIDFKQFLRNRLTISALALPGVLAAIALTALILTPVVMVALAAPKSAFGYGTFTHEELIDLAWNDSIRPLLLHRYPGTTEIGLREAHAFAYGGCLIQDLGYYPFGRKLFSDLTHYVRSGDFVLSLLRHAQSVNEFAFAIGALSHYVGDSIGHAEGVNPSTAITFPDLEKQYGRIVTYEEDPTAHVRTEFGFDVAQMAFWRYAPKEYRKQIGFRVSRTLLERAFYETYGLTVRSILGPPRAAMVSYHTAVRRLIPLFAEATIVNVGRHLPPDQPGPALGQLRASISQTDYANYWGQFQHKPTLKDHVLGVIIRLVPKVGILKILAIKAPSSQTEELFVKSLNVALTRFQELLTELSNGPSGELALANRDLDTGFKVRPGAYRLTDRAYAELLHKVTEKPGLPIPAGLREDILAYYADPAAPISTKRNRKTWQKVLAQLKALQQDTPAESR